MEEILGHQFDCVDGSGEGGFGSNRAIPRAMLNDLEALITDLGADKWEGCVEDRVLWLGGVQDFILIFGWCCIFLG